jgi:xanthine dehydrogenase YagT iron-sulfur-binding subunit
MSDQSESDEKSEAESRFEFGKASRRTFLSRLGMASLIASAGSITPAFGERSGQGQISSSESKDAVPVSLRVNGKKYDLRIDPRTSLLDCLREHLHLTGSKKGCDHGQCGACTVHINGRRVNSCLCLAATGHHLATFTSKVTVLSPPAFLMTNLYSPSFAGVIFTEHFGPGESSLPTSLPASS